MRRGEVVVMGQFVMYMIRREELWGKFLMYMKSGRGLAIYGEERKLYIGLEVREKLLEHKEGLKNKSLRKKRILIGSEKSLC